MDNRIMQREIEFRIFDKTMKRWLCPDSQYLVMDGSKVLPAPWSSLEFDVGDDNFIIQQYTGLKDKNDVKIFEGDIIETPNGNSKFENIIMSVEYPFITKKSNIVEVIGNIFDVSYQVKIIRQTA
jgi:uncharacterized phage protein (TIGR01671 family)